LDLWGGGSCRLLGSDELLKGRGGPLRPNGLISASDNRVGRR
jgi:hypothetical protein